MSRVGIAHHHSAITVGGAHPTATFSWTFVSQRLIAVHPKMPLLTHPHPFAKLRAGLTLPLKGREIRYLKRPYRIHYPDKPAYPLFIPYYAVSRIDYLCVRYISRQHHIVRAYILRSYNSAERDVLCLIVYYDLTPAVYNEVSVRQSVNYLCSENGSKVTAP